MKVFVINLARSHDRRNTISNRLSALGCDYEIFEAIDGRIEPHALFERYDDNLRSKHRRRPLSGGELGAWASHFLLWKKCKAIGEPIIVMEDDVEIKELFADVFEYLARKDPCIDYFRLAGTKRRKYFKYDSISGFDFVRYMHGPTGAQCYYLTPSAASRFIAHANSWFIAVDDYMDRYWLHGVECLALTPYPVCLKANESNISRLKKDGKSQWSNLRYEFRKIEEWGHRLLFFARKYVLGR